jgi:hypothetical protein
MSGGNDFKFEMGWAGLGCRSGQGLLQAVRETRLAHAQEELEDREPAGSSRFLSRVRDRHRMAETGRGSVSGAIAARRVRAEGEARSRAQLRASVGAKGRSGFGLHRAHIARLGHYRHADD